jgi:hypothetical protein
MLIGLSLTHVFCVYGKNDSRGYVLLISKVKITIPQYE